MKKILIVDDDRSIRVLLNFILSTEYKITLKKDAYEALSYLEEGHIPDAIISDLSMPKVSGHIFLKILKSSSILNKIPFMFLSSKDDSQKRVECLKQGADDYLLKPFNPEELQLRILKLFKKISYV